MSSERERQRRLEKKRRKREERRRSSTADGVEHSSAPVGRPISDTLPRFAAPWLARLPDDVDDDVMKLVLELAAFVWNTAIVGGDLDSDALEVGRRLFAGLGWTEDVQEEARKLRQRKAILFPGEKRLVLGVEIAREGNTLRVYAASAVA